MEALLDPHEPLRLAPSQHARSVPLPRRASRGNPWRQPTPRSARWGASSSSAPATSRCGPGTWTGPRRAAGGPARPARRPAARAGGPAGRPAPARAGACAIASSSASITNTSGRSGAASCGGSRSAGRARRSASRPARSGLEPAPERDPDRAGARGRPRRADVEPQRVRPRLARRPPATAARRTRRARSAGGCASPARGAPGRRRASSRRPRAAAPRARGRATKQKTWSSASTRATLPVGMMPRMRPDELDAMARRVIDGNHYMTLGTTDPDGAPRLSPVYYTPAGYDRLYWVSSPDAHHSRNVAGAPGIQIVIFDSSVPVGAGEAVYLAAEAAEVAEGELEAVARRGVPDDCRRARRSAPDELRGDTDLRLYRARITGCEVHVAGAVARTAATIDIRMPRHARLRKAGRARIRRLRMDVPIRPARRDELDAVSALIARSFRAEPFMAWVSGGDQRRLARFAALAVHGEPHATLIALGVEPGEQAHGRGSAMLAAVERHVGVPVYLETGSAPVREGCRRRGYGVHAELRLPGGGPRMWTMIGPTSAGGGRGAVEHGGMAASEATVVDAGGRELRVSNPSRVIFPATERTREVDQARRRRVLPGGRRRHPARAAPAADHARALAQGRAPGDRRLHARAGRRRRLLPEADPARRARTTSRPRASSSRPAGTPTRSARPRSRSSAGRRRWGRSPSIRGRCAPTTSTTRTSCGSTSTRSRGRTSPTPCASRPRRGRCSPTSATPASRRPRAAAACTSTCGSSRAGRSPTSATPRSPSGASSSGAFPGR